MYEYEIWSISTIKTQDNIISGQDFYVTLEPKMYRNGE